MKMFRRSESKNISIFFEISHGCPGSPFEKDVLVGDASLGGEARTMGRAGLTTRPPIDIDSGGAPAGTVPVAIGLEIGMFFVIIMHYCVCLHATCEHMSHVWVDVLVTCK